MASQMMEALAELCQEKHIDQGALINELEQSLADSYATVLHLPFGAEVTSAFPLRNPTTRRPTCTPSTPRRT